MNCEAGPWAVCTIWLAWRATVGAPLQPQVQAQADELKAQLTQAGFDVADGGLSFSLSGQGGQAQGDSAAGHGLMGGRAFRSAAAGAEDLLTQVNEAASRLSAASPAGGLDIRI